jgi:hypothetical protein
MKTLETPAMCRALEKDLGRLRASHDALLAAAKLALVELRINWPDPTLRQVALENLEAAIAEAEEFTP